MEVKKIITQFITATNAFDVGKALALFTDKAFIDDVSVGEKFKNKRGVREYLEKFFVGYKTSTRIESVEIFNDKTAKVKVDFTGKFGHETGGLNFSFNKGGLITAIDAYLD